MKFFEKQLTKLQELGFATILAQPEFQRATQPYSPIECVEIAHLILEDFENFCFHNSLKVTTKSWERYLKEIYCWKEMTSSAIDWYEEQEPDPNYWNGNSRANNYSAVFMRLKRKNMLTGVFDF
jgi:hypothetical protein